MLTDKEVKHIADLARIKLTGQEQEKFKKELSLILNYIDTLQKVNTDSVKPLYQVTGLENSVRSDESTDWFSMREELLINQAPTKEERFVKVKTVLKK